MKNFNHHIKKMALHLNLSEEHVNNLLLDHADTFLRGYAQSEESVALWKATPEFWGWWQQVWLNRDLVVLKRYPQRITAENRAKMYAVWHDPKTMHIRPNSVVYDGFVRTAKQKQKPIKQTA